MARYTFGGFGGDLVIQDPAQNSGLVKSYPNLPSTGTFWSAKTGGTQYTDLIDPSSGGAPIAGISTDSHGRFVPFQGPSGIAEGWLDFGAGRFKATAVDANYDARITTNSNDIATSSTRVDSLIPTAPAPNGSDDTSALQSFLNANAGKTVRFQQAGAYRVNGSLTPGNHTKVDLQGATITQLSASMVPVFDCLNVNGFTVRDGAAVGNASAYTESTTVYPAAFVRGHGTSRNLRVVNCDVSGFPGPAMYATDTVGVYVSGCTIVGVGNGGGAGTFAFTAGTSKDNAGVIIDGAASRVFILENDISYTCQGVLGGQGTASVHVRGNEIHDIGGQHGVYLNQTVSAEISGNIVKNTQGAGLKVQTQSGAPDCTGVAICGNSIDTVAANGIIATCADNTVPSRHRDLAITGNTIRGASNDGIVLEYVDGAVCAGNIINGARAGIRVTDFSNVTVRSNRVENAQQDGILVQALTFASAGFTIGQNDILNPGQAALSSSQFGIRVAEAGGAATCTDGSIEGNRIVDKNAKARYLIYISTASMATLGLRRNHGSGATDYGFRAPATTAKEFAGNNLVGSLGRLYALPSDLTIGDPFFTTFAAAAPATGTWARGDRCWNTTPAASGAPGWVCVTAGTPGTWKAMASLSA